jgi:enamine deaminase RidA (YjgF/YER057c/UK114 family)
MKPFLSLFILCVTIPAFAANPQKPSKAVASKSPVRFYNPDNMAKPVSDYSQVAEVSGGKTIYIAGQVALDPSGTLVAPNDFRAQVEQVLKNIKAAVTAAGGDMSSLVKTNYYVAEAVDPAQFSALREIRDRYINTAAPPTSTFVVVKRLVRPEYLIEVEAVAVVRK